MARSATSPVPRVVTSPYTESELAYHPGPTAPDARLTWRNRTGTAVGTASDSVGLANLDLSPDGTRVAVSSRGHENHADIWIVDLARDGDKVRLTSDPADEFDPNWSPTASRLSLRPTEPLVDSVCFGERPTEAARTSWWPPPSPAST